MTPKEKANELVEKFKTNDYDWIAQGNDYCVKQHALVCANEFLNFMENLIITEDSIAYQYWQEVKKELEKQ